MKEVQPCKNANVTSRIFNEHMVQMDILWSSSRSRHGDKSKWTELYPLADETATTVAEAMVKVLTFWFDVHLEMRTGQSYNDNISVMVKIGRLPG